MTKYRLLHIPTGKYVIRLLHDFSISDLWSGTYWLDGISRHIYDKTLMDFKYIWYKKTIIDLRLRTDVALDLYFVEDRDDLLQTQIPKKEEFEWVKVR